MIEDLKGIETFRIICGDSIREYFEKYIQQDVNDIFESETTTDEENRIKKNYIYFYDRISGDISKYDSKSNKEKYLQDLIEKISKLLIIDISIGNELDAYDIFETTNASQPHLYKKSRGRETWNSTKILQCNSIFYNSDS